MALTAQNNFFKRRREPNNSEQRAQNTTVHSSQRREEAFVRRLMLITQRRNAQCAFISPVPARANKYTPRHLFACDRAYTICVAQKARLQMCARLLFCGPGASLKNSRAQKAPTNSRTLPTFPHTLKAPSNSNLDARLLRPRISHC